MRTACTVMIRLAAAFAVLAPVVAIGGCGDGSSTPPAPGGAGRPAPGGSSYLASRPIQSVNGKIDLGAVNLCDQKLVRIERIRNQSSETLEILGYASNCGCLDAELIGSKTLAPGEEREVKLTVNPAGSGVRSIAVEFATAAGFAGVMRVDYSINRGAVVSPGRVAVHAGDREAVIDIDVLANDGAPLKVLSIDPPIGTILPTEGSMGKVALSSFEAARFVESPEGRAHRGFRAGPNGKPASLNVDIVTDSATCPVATVTLTFDP